MLYLTRTMLSNLDLAHYGVSCTKDWVSVDCGISKVWSRKRETPSTGLELSFVNISVFSWPCFVNFRQTLFFYFAKVFIGSGNLLICKHSLSLSPS